MRTGASNFSFKKFIIHDEKDKLCESGEIEVLNSDDNNNIHIVYVICFTKFHNNVYV